MSVCVYAIIATAAPRDARISGRGVTGERLRIVRGRAVSAVVGTVSARPRPTPLTLAEYDRIVRTVGARSAAVLPARFGTVVDDDRELTEILAVRGVSLRSSLARVRGRAQMTLRVPIGMRSGRVRDGFGMQPEPVPNASRTGPESGAQYLRTRAGKYKAPEIDALRPAISRWVRDERVERKGDVVTVYHLIPRSAVDAYLRAVSGAPGVRPSGPFPPYAFAEGW